MKSMNCITRGSNSYRNMDSKLVISQLNWEWKIKKAELKQINDDIKEIINDSNVELICNWVRRDEKNKQIG